MAKPGPKLRTSKLKVDDAVASYVTQTFQSDNTKEGLKLFCKLCCTHVNCDDSARLSQYVRTATHRKKIHALERYANEETNGADPSNKRSDDPPQQLLSGMWDEKKDRNE
jgi:hypothetical protein